jgi:outer membrane protein assembly factor BamB
MKIIKHRPCLAALFFLCCAVLTAQNGAPAAGAANTPAADSGEPLKAVPIWRQALGGVITGLATVQAQSAVAVLDGGTIKAYSTSGKQLWTYFAKGKLSPFVTRSREGTCYFSRLNGNFFAVNRAGRELWSLNPGGPLTGSVIAGWDGRIFVPTGKRLTCYTASGHLLWHHDFESTIALSPKLTNAGSIILVLENAGFLHIDPFGNIGTEPLAEVPFEILPLGPVSPRESSGRTLVINKDGSMRIIDPALSMPPAPLPPLPVPPLAAVSRANKAAVTLSNGNLVLINDDGTVRWTGESHLRRFSRGNTGTRINEEVSMIYDERGIYVLSKSGASGFTEDGRRLWFMRLDNTAAIPVFGDDGILYSCGTDWILYAYKLEERILNTKQSVYGPSPDGEYGTGNPPPSYWSDDYFRYDEQELKKELEIIEEAVKAGRIGSSELSYLGYLMETAEAGIFRPGESKLHPPVEVRYRVRAIQLLGSLGSRETIPFLASLFTRDKDGAVRAAAADAIGNIGLDPEGLALKAFQSVLFGAPENRDERAMVSVAGATGALCRFSGPPLSDAGLKILTILSSGANPQSVQARARREIAGLR